MVTMVGRPVAALSLEIQICSVPTYLFFSADSVPKMRTVRMSVSTSVAIWFPRASCSCSVAAALRENTPYLRVQNTHTRTHEWSACIHLFPAEVNFPSFGRFFRVLPGLLTSLIERDERERVCKVHVLEVDGQNEPQGERSVTEELRREKPKVPANRERKEGARKGVGRTDNSRWRRTSTSTESVSRCLPAITFASFGCLFRAFSGR